MTRKEIIEYLKCNDVKPSHQRIEIYKYLINKKNHPTVDMIFKELAKSIPTLSKTTVYNTLRTFIEKNIAMVLTIEDNEARYDAVIKTHGHFKCTKCGKVYDFEIDSNLNLEKFLPEGVDVDMKHIYVNGICNKKFKKNNS